MNIVKITNDCFKRIQYMFNGHHGICIQWEYTDGIVFINLMGGLKMKLLNVETGIIAECDYIDTWIYEYYFRNNGNWFLIS